MLKMAPSGKTTLFLVRHGDRFDYANAELWRGCSERLGFEHRDPPLSALGHQQSREVASKLMELTGGAVDALLVSPYLRVLQTAQPFAHASRVPISVEEGLAETGHVPGSIPSPELRFPYFPEIDLGYEMMIPEIVATGTDPHTSRPNELYPLDYFRRIARLADRLPKRFAGKTVVCYSHAASISLVAHLTRATGIRDVGRFAPCGIFKLSLNEDAWQVDLHGAENAGHISENAASTYPWGFLDSRWPVEEQWTQVLDELVRTP